MSTNEDRAPLEAAQESAAPQTGEAAAPAPAETPAATSAAHDSLSPAVRRLVRQFDLDITGIHGTGPEGRIRVGDVMSLLNGRTDSGNRDAPARPVAAQDDDVDDTDANLEPAAADAAPLAPLLPDTAPAAGHPTTTVFDCDLSRVLSHRKRLRRDDVELATTSYFLTALAAALDAAPDVTAGEPPRFGISLSTTDGELRSALVDAAAVPPAESLEERVRAFDAALRANLDVGLAGASLLVHHYGESGSVLATPTSVGAGHAASVGIGRVRREIVVRHVDGVETPRVAARCYLSLTFFPDKVSLHRANRILGEAVRLLEQWPD